VQGKKKKKKRANHHVETVPEASERTRLDCAPCLQGNQAASSPSPSGLQESNAELDCAHLISPASPLDSWRVDLEAFRDASPFAAGYSAMAGEGANTYACEHFAPSVLQSCDNCQTSSSQQAVHDETMMGSTVRWY
jgi:hypothetical protein